MNPDIRVGAALGVLSLVLCGFIGLCFGGAQQLNHGGPEAWVGLLIGLGCGAIVGVVVALAYIDSRD